MENNYVMVEDTRFYLERHGRGDPLLMIPGLGAGTWLWRKNVEALAQHFHLLMPELRGSGRSDKPDHPYSVALFAGDLKSMLDRLDLYKVNILGASLGGLVAQDFAARWPERVGKLILAATSLGGQNQQGPSGEVLCRIIRPRGKTKRERLEDGYPFNFSENFRQKYPEELERITAWRTEYPQPEFAYYRQLLAGNAYNGAELAKRITTPTLICTGEDDPLVPLPDAQALQQTISGARLQIFPGRHLFFFEHSDRFNQTALEFFKQ